MAFSRITHDPAVMGGKPCIRGLRISVGTIVGLVASGVSRERILAAYPLLESPDIDEALAYAAWRLEEREEALVLT
ncbi:MAG: hypothetical protein RLZZ54_770 [Cyanobacteriota bacterium]|jgi:uncharacterized protein (DUF433 family)|uniref:DUF433 domain-containing protein n=1 Tax=Vulcanococcus sp. Clear-D1 TaxID=2766970 RepID=UPI0019B0B38A|nr:DUF433 domain-containing protein [Vulcanococcus sp. Clear-D1]MBD1194514.1 DUF433 domain-containing protein [Vulcanococcus sp. Clear-D1]